MLNAPEIIVTSTDYERLSSLLASVSSSRSDAAERLEHELERARIVPGPQVPADVVTMNSRIEFEDVEAGVRRELTLVYPYQADIEASRVSVLAPIGSALLGLRIGQVIEWPVPGNRSKRIRVLRMLYQPEAAGDFHL